MSFKFYIFLTLFSCSFFVNHDVKLDDIDVEVLNRFYSPDSAMILYQYSYWRGNNPSFKTAIVKTSDTTGLISKYNLPNYGRTNVNDLKPMKWIDNDTFLMELDPTLTNRLGKVFKGFQFEKNNVVFKVIEKDLTYGLPPNIERYSISPDNSKLLVAYRYSGSSHIEISVIDFTDMLPKTGNIYTTYKPQMCPILFGSWQNNNCILLESEGHWPIGLTANKLDLEVVVKKTQDKPIYSNVNAGWYNKKLFDEQNSDFYFNGVSKEITGFITKRYKWGDSYHSNLDNYNYEYEHNGVKFQSYFRYGKFNNSLQVGDSVRILVNIKQPIVHKLLEEYSR